MSKYTPSTECADILTSFGVTQQNAKHSKEDMVQVSARFTNIPEDQYCCCIPSVLQQVI